jgi:hypothetical protein
MQSFSILKQVVYAEGLGSNELRLWSYGKWHIVAW